MWEKVKLGDIISLEYGKPLIKEDRNEFGDFNVYASGGLVGKHSSFFIENQTIVVGRKGSIGSITYSENPCWVIDTAYYVVLRQNVHLRYLFFALKQLNLASLNKAAAVPGLNRNDVYEKRIPLPPLHIQEQIADTLDKADALRKKDQELLKKYDELAQSIFYDIFGDPVKNERGWVSYKLQEVCLQITDGTHFSPPPAIKGFPYITAKHITTSGIDFFSNPSYVDEDHHREIYARCKPQKGDVIYIKDGSTTGLAAINEYDFEFSMLSSLALIKPDRRLMNNVFLMYWFNNESVNKKLISEFMAGAAIKRFTLSKINQFVICLPPISLQESFSLKIRALDKLRFNKKEGSEYSSSLFETIISRAF